MSNRFKSFLYTEECLIVTKNGISSKMLPNGWLYSNMRYPTKIRPVDLPEWYIEGIFYKCHGYISLKDVKYLIYKPNYVFNHFHKDDILYISYNKPIVEVEAPFLGRSIKDYIGYDLMICGHNILNFISQVTKFSDIEVEDIIKEIYKKSEWMIKTYPEDPEVIYSDHMKYLDKIFGGKP